MDGQEGTPRKEVRAALLYPADRAGALMDPRVRLLRGSSTIVGGLERLRQDRQPGLAGFFVVDSDSRLTGWVDMQEISLAESHERIADFVRGVGVVTHT